MQDLTTQAKLIYNKQQITAAIDKMANKITTDMNGKKPILLCVVNGGIFITGQLLERITIPLELDYIHATRYNNDVYGKEIRWRATPATEIKDRNIVVIDDVLDQGITLKEIEKWCLQQGASSVYNVVLFDKTECRSPNGVQQADCCGLVAPNEYLFGCGLDVKGYYRNTSELYSIPTSMLQELDKFIP